jgi:hypothetical protein
MEYNLETHLSCTDYDNAFDRIQTEILFDILKCINIPDTLLKAMTDT